MFKRFISSFEWFLIIFVIGTHLYAVFSPANSLMNWFTTDDAFYYFKPAQNIIEGFGSTFDRIGVTNGYHPLWMLICIPLFFFARYDLILPLRLVVLVLAIFNAASAVILFRLAGKALAKPVAMVLAVLWAFSISIHSVTTMLGMESGVNAFFLLLFFYQLVNLEGKRKIQRVANSDILKLAVIASLVLLSRLDNIFLILIMGIWVVTASRSLRLFLLGDLVIILFTFAVSFYLRLGLPQLFGFFPSLLVSFIVGLLIYPAVFLGFGLYDSQRGFGWKTVFKIFLAVSLASLIFAVVIYVLLQVHFIAQYPRSVLITSWVIIFPLVLLLRFTAAQAFHEPDPIGMGSWRDQMKGWLTRGALFYGPLLLVLVSYMVFNYVTVGTTSPVSGQIKRWWGTIYTVYGRPPRDLPELLGVSNPNKSPWSLAISLPAKMARKTYDAMIGVPFKKSNPPAFYTNAVNVYSILLMAALLLVVLTRWKRIKHLFSFYLMVPWLVGCLVQIGSYQLSGYVATHSWYWISEMIWLMLGFGILLDCLLALGSNENRKTDLALAVALVICLGFVASFYHNLTVAIPWKVRVDRREAYLGGVKLLEAKTAPGSVIGSTGGGILGYFIKDRTIVNLDGLINSAEYFRMMQAGTANRYLDRIGLDYVYGTQYMITDSEPYMEMFKDRVEYLDELAGSSFYRYK